MDNKKYILGLYEKSMPDSLTWVEKLTEAKAAGYDQVEISIDESEFRLARLYNHEFVDEIKAAIQQVGLPIRSMCLSGHRKYPLGSHDINIQEKALDIFYRAVDLADEIGVKIIQLAGYDVYYEERDEQTYQDFLKNLEKGIRYASAKGVFCGFETMETPFMNSIAKAMKVVRLFDNPYCNIYPDLGNITNSAKSDPHDLSEDIASGKGHILAAHLKETKPGIFREVEFGDGHVDFAKGVKLLWNQGVRFYNIEFWHSEKTDFRERLRFNRAYISKYLNQQE